MAPKTGSSGLMIGQLRRTFALLSARERRKLGWLLGAMVVTGLFDVIGISSIFPFMAVVAHPESVETSKVLSYFYHALGFASTYRFLFALGVAVLVLVILGNALTALMTTMMLRFAYGVGHGLSVRMLADYLRKPYAFFLDRNSATMALNVVGEASGVGLGVVLPALQTLAKTIIAVFVLILLLAVDPILALIVAATVGGAYLLIFQLVRRRLFVIGESSAEANRVRHKTVSELLGGIKEFKILGRTQDLLGRFSSSSEEYAKFQTQHGLIAALPRYAIESIAFSSILLILLYLLAIRKDINQALPLIALYAVAGYRLMPAIQQIFGGVAQLRFGLSSLTGFHRELDFLTASLSEEDGESAASVPLAFESSVELRSVSYRYPSAGRETLETADIFIEKNTTVGVVGPSGSGKTTLVDILLGLLEPTQGAVFVDGKQLHRGNVRAWRSRMGYVPQHIYLAADSMMNNIAFAVPASEIDMTQVRRAARLANLNDLIEADLPQGYNTLVGERGARLSGGQRQRVGIARALYHDPDILVFDEATSALDSVTEDVIINAIRSLAHSKTIVLVAHRFSTIRDCDVIYMIENGVIADSGTFDELSQRSAAFRNLGKMSQDDASLGEIVKPQ